MTDAQHKAPASPLKVKEQLEATASRFWTSVTMANNNNNNNKGPTTNDALGIPMGLFTKKSFGSSEEAQNNGHGPCHIPQPNSLKLVLNTMFSSCTTGRDNTNFETDSHCDGSTVPSLLQHASHSRTAATTALTPTNSRSFSSSRGETSAPGPVTPSPLHKQQPNETQSQTQHQKQVAAVKTLFKNNHDIAQEAIHRLRQQHQREQIEKVIVANNSLNYESSEVAVDTERDHSVFSHSILSKNPSLLSANAPSTLSMGPSTLASNNRTVSSSLLEPQAQAQAKQPLHHQSQSRRSSLQKLISNRSVKKTAKMASEKTPVRTAAHQGHHSFFPASKPKDLLKTTTNKEQQQQQQQQQRLKKKLRRNKGVPKEVATPASPMRRTLKHRNMQRQKQILNGSNHGDDVFFGTGDEQDANDSWDMNDDGISDITHATVDRMVFAISQHLRVFPEEAETLNRVHSDVTDPVPKRGATKKKIHTGDNTNTTSSDQLFPMIGGDVAGFSKIVTPPRGGGGYSPVKKGMSPGLFTRNIGSVGTRSFFTKTTQSTLSQDFANAWKVDEQRFWDTEVAKESHKEFDKPKNHTNTNNGDSNDHGVINKCPKSPGQMMVIKHKRTKQRYGTAHTTTSTITTAKSFQTASFGAPQSPLSLFRQQAQAQHPNFEEHTSREVFLSEHDLLMDSMVLQNEAEI